jgi:hypothetical protein
MILFMIIGTRYNGKSLQRWSSTPLDEENVQSFYLNSKTKVMMLTDFHHPRKRILLAVIAGLLLPFLPGCKCFYEVKTVKPVSQNQLRYYDSQERYFILHRNDSAWHVFDRAIKGSAVTGILTELPENHRKYLTTDPAKGNNRYRKNKHGEAAVLQEVHLYVTDSTTPAFSAGDQIRVDISAIQRAEVYQKNVERTRASWLIPGIGVPVGVSIGFIIVIAISASSMSFHLSP